MGLLAEVTESVRDQLDPDVSVEIGAHSSLDELGLSSVQVVTLMLSLQQRYGLDIDSLVSHGVPATVADLVALVSRSDRVASRNPSKD